MHIRIASLNDTLHVSEKDKKASFTVFGTTTLISALSSDNTQCLVVLPNECLLSKFGTDILEFLKSDNGELHRVQRSVDVLNASHYKMLSPLAVHPRYQPIQVCDMNIIRCRLDILGR